MSKKNKQHSHNNPEKNEEKILKFDDIKDMTVGQVVRKQRDLKDGIEEDDNVLDRYIKQHREDIEAEKFETLVNAPALSDESIEEVTETEEAVGESSTGETASEITSTVEEDNLTDVQVATEADLQIHKVSESQKEKVSPMVPVPTDSDVELDDDKIENKKRVLIWLALATTFVAVLATAFVWMNNTNNNQTKDSTSSTSKTSSSSTDANIVAFNELYASFFTDSSRTKLKNSEFDKLEQLKAALDNIGTSNAGYKTAKAKYDILAKAIQAIKAMNDKFDKPVIVDGELDTTATVKPGMSFEAVSTGLSAVDTLLTSAINMGRTQKPSDGGAGQQVQASDAGAGQGQAGGSPEAGSAQDTPAAPIAPAPPVASVNPNNPGWVNVAGIIYGMEIPAGLQLQRHLSRVPYNQSAIDDVHNEAWVFNPGILENIINIARERGHISGNEYYLEKVNIINGRGYYNLFRTDGTYLFSINCKTGYFVGNAPGRADDLDF